MAMENSREVHSLVLKVMRLSKPSLLIGHPIISEVADMTENALDEVFDKDVTLPRHFPSVGLGEFLALPQNFGNIFLGETFSSYISVHNESNAPVKDVTIKSELQTSSQRVTLSDPSPQNTVDSGVSIDTVVHHEVKELGVHILVCSVSYRTPEGERKIFRKFFKFNVLHPLAVKTKVYNVEENVFLEAQVQNITPSPMYIEMVRFEPIPTFEFEDLNVLKQSHAPVNSNPHVYKPSNSPFPTTFGNSYHINPQDVRQYLYRLYPKIKGDKAARLSDKIGKMDILWKTNMGEMGRLQTSQLPRKLPTYNDVDVIVVQIPDNIVLETPFSIDCKIVNYSDRKMSLKLVAEKSRMSGVLVNGVSGQTLGEIPPEGFRMFKLDLFPIAAGLQKVSGLRVLDGITGRSIDLENVTDVFVHTGPQTSTVLSIDV